jgi:hypothetical protein
MTDIAWQADNVTATASIAGLGSFQFEGSVDQASGALTGRLFVPGADDENMTVKGKSAH